MNHANLVIRALRLFSIASLVVGGTLTTLFFYPICSVERRQILKKKWSFALIKAMGVRIEADLINISPGAMLVANHISWIDVFVINAVLPSAFIAKDDVKRWPLFGWLARKNETFFIKRKSPKQARETNHTIASLLNEEKHVTVFPEGTTTNGMTVLAFHAALIQPALDVGKPVVPVAISYWEPDGQKSLAPRYDGNISIYQSMMSVLSRRRLIARLVTMEPLGLGGETRQEIAQAARAAILANQNASHAKINMDKNFVVEPSFF